MYQFLNRSDANYCIIDHESLAIQILDEEALWELMVYERVEIRGLTLKQVNFKPRWFGTAECDFAGGDNIWAKANRLVIDNQSRFSVWSNNQPLNGVVDTSDELAVVFKFDFGMNVPMMRDDYEELLSNDKDRVVRTLKKLATPLQDKGWLPSEYEEALESGDAERLKSVVRKMVAAGRYPVAIRG